MTKSRKCLAAVSPFSTGDGAGPAHGSRLNVSMVTDRRELEQESQRSAEKREEGPVEAVITFA
mgnify:CR=1 FL=1